MESSRYQKKRFENPRQPIPSSVLRVPPQNIDSERALLGSIMLRPDALVDIIDLTTLDSFYVEKHRLIWQGMLDLYSKSEPIDLLSLSSRLKEKGFLEQVGGATYLADLVNTVPSAANIRHYAEIVHRKFMMRRLIDAAESINTLGYDETEELEMLLEKAEQELYQLTTQGGTKKFIDLKDVLPDIWEQLEKLHHNKDTLRGVRTGFKDLDDRLAGLQKSDLIILAARPSMGKTALALDIARQTASLHQTPVCIFSLEMSNDQLIQRMLAAESRVNAWNLRTGRFSLEEDSSKIRDALDRLSRAPIVIDDMPGNNILKMRSVARQMKRERGLGLIVVDQLGARPRCTCFSTFPAK